MPQMNLSIEDIGVRHLDRLYKIEKQCFAKEAFTKRQIAYMLRDYSSVGLVARLNGEIVGFIIGTIHIKRKMLAGHILTIDVLPEHRRKGIAQRLLEEVEGVFKEKGASASQLEVREDNVAAIRLYQKLGYQKVAQLIGYYGDSNGICLEKQLVQPQ